MTRGYYGAIENIIVTGMCYSIEEAEVAIQNHHIFDLNQGGTDDQRQYRIVSLSDYEMYIFSVAQNNKFGTHDGSRICKLEKVVNSRRKTNVELLPPNIV